MGIIILKGNSGMKILILGAYPNSIISFRGQLIKSLVAGGNEVMVMTAPASAQIIAQIELLGATFTAFPVQRNGLNPLADLQTCYFLTKVMKAWRPDKILAYTIKPVIWGGIANSFTAKADFYALISGLGYAFEAGSLLRNLVNQLVKRLYKFSLSTSKAVIFQNEDNQQVFIDKNIIPADKAHRVFGSGVNIDDYSPQALPKGPTTFLLIARLLGDKGLREYMQAAKQVKQRYPEVIFQLLGPADSSPDRIDLEEVRQWQQAGIIDYLGETDNVQPYLADCHIYTLPSYHEGLPRTVLEAMAIGRPILTTDVPGCRDTVIDHENGLLVAAKDSDALRVAMIWFIEHSAVWHDMASASRNLACQKFDANKVNQHIADIIQAPIVITS